MSTLRILNIKGQLPKSLARCGRLRFVNLEENQIIDTFPCLLKNISTLSVLVLQSNNLYGGIGCPVVKTNGTWPVLHIRDLAYNNFNGEVPSFSLTSWQAMKTKILVSCRKCFASGPIPKDMGDLKSLYLLNLLSNTFTGEIPSFGNMRQLEYLDLSQNKMSGQIPQQLAKLNFLAFLDLSNNQFTGKIPVGTQISTSPRDSFTGNKGLWGPPLMVDNKARLSPPPTFKGSHPNSTNEIDWDLISIEIGFTFGFAIAVGSLVFFKR
ncbi:hypothetical protein C1H46_020070 [Malus baccata]|uniref:Leucine-rich repeat-containing N-terminal plant-type domain-containing protein n=1 Tax=Malus baccata TaxID=106549 RepID=A0A540M6C1_MALBA|nr:hypothetical protein C1H46_020070 [Malus baccata]